MHNTLPAKLELPDMRLIKEWTNRSKKNGWQFSFFMQTLKPGKALWKQRCIWPHGLNRMCDCRFVRMYLLCACKNILPVGVASSSSWHPAIWEFLLSRTFQSQVTSRSQWALNRDEEGEEGEKKKNWSPTNRKFAHKKGRSTFYFLFF